MFDHEHQADRRARLAPLARQLRRQGLLYREIGARLGIDRTTAKAYALSAPAVLPGVLTRGMICYALGYEPYTV